MGVHRCPTCYGTGLSRKGGPCRRCRATGQVSGMAAVGAHLNAAGTAINQVVWSVVALAVIVLVIVAAIQS